MIMSGENLSNYNEFMPKIAEKTILKIIADCAVPHRTAQRALYDLLFDHIMYNTGRFNFSKAEQQDQIQETYIKIFSNLDKFDHKKSNLFTWTSVVTKRVCLSFITKKKIELSQIDDLSHEIGIEDLQSDFLELKIIYGLIEALPEMCNKVFNLSIVQGLNHEDIASLLEITPSSSRAYLSRAKKILREEVLNQNVITTNYLNLKIKKNV